MTIPEKDLADIALGGLRSHLKENLQGLVYYSINGLQLRAMSQEFKNSKDAYKPHRSNTHVVENDSDSSSDDDKEVYAAKPSSCFKSIGKKR